MVSSGTTITHPRPSSLSGLQGTTTTNPKASSSPPPNISSPSPVPVPPSRSHTHTDCKEDSVSVSVATAISFATPENSPFLANKKVTVLNSNPLNHHNNNNNKSGGAGSTMEGGVMRVTVPSSNNNTKTSLAQSVTPQEKAAKFKGDNMHINDGPSSEPSLSGPHSNPLISVGDADVAYGNENKGTKNASSDKICDRHLSPPTIMNSNDRNFVTSPLSSRGKSRAQQPPSAPSSSPAINTEDSASNKNNDVPIQAQPHTQGSAQPQQAQLQSQPQTAVSAAVTHRMGLIKNDHPQEVPPTLSVSTASTSSSSPSRIPSLQPRKFTETMPHHQHVSSACSDAGDVSVPPSLCSSTCSPQNDGKEDNKHQHQQQHELGDAGHVKVENDAQQVMMVNIGASIASSSSCNNNDDNNNNGSNSVDPNVLRNKHENTDNSNISNYNQQQNNNNYNNTIHRNNKKKNSSISTGPVNKNRTGSPVPPTNSRPPQARTPVRSPVATKYGAGGSRLNVEIAPFGSPGIFLSPYLPSPPDSRKAGMGAVGQKSTTPTNFAKDFGKGDLGSSSFDATNALPWLSPTAYSLFSPGGGIASAINTPGGMFSSAIPRTPRTPNGTRLSLPLTSDAVGADGKKKTPGISSMICVSPLASRKSSNTTVSIKGEKTQNSTGNNSATAMAAASNIPHPGTPINFKEVFASPKTDSRGMIRAEPSNEIPTLGHPNEAASNEELSSRLSLEKHTAERDVREDEDLNVLLKLAETTPNRRAAEPKQSRSFRNQNLYDHPGSMYSLPTGGNPPASLHLPYIGKHGTNSSAGKGRKKNTSGTKSDEFTPPPLPIRSTNATSPSKGSKNADQGKSKAQDKKGSFQQNTGHPKSAYPYPGTPGHVHHPGAGAYPHPPPHFMHPHGPYYSYPPPHPGSLPGSGHPPPPPPPYPTIYSNPPVPPGSTPDTKKGQKAKGVVPKTTAPKRQANSPNTEARKRAKKTTSRKGGKRTRTTVTQPLSGPEREKSAATITAINAATGNKNDKAASLASAILRGVTMRPSGKWQAQLYYAGKSRYIGVFDTREKAALAYEIAREKLKTDKPASEQGAQSIKETEANVNAARKAAFEGVNEKDPRNAK